MKRRDFLKGPVLVGAGGTLLAGCAPPGSDQIIPILIPEDQFIPGVETFLAATCFECPGGCGLLARKIDGRLVKVEGNPAHPVSQGGSCARGQAQPQALYHPDRLRGPLMRVGDRGEGRWRSASWEEAIERIVTELAALRQAESPESLACLTGTLRGHRLQMVHRFLSAFGTPHHWVHEPFGEHAVRQANALTTGVDAFFVHDLERAGYVLSLGAALIDGPRSPVMTGRGLGALRRGRPGRRGRLVAVEPRLSLTAANADEWLPARQGTEVSLALALAHVIVRDELHDATFVAQRGVGFEEWRDRVLPRFAPEVVAESIGVRAVVLERIAREAATSGSAVVLAGGSAVSGPHGLATGVAVAHLNALLGAYGRAGGIFFDPAPPFAEWPPISDNGDGSGIVAQPFASCVEALRNGELAVQALLVSGANPLYSLPPSFGATEALAQIPFIANFAAVADDTTWMADLILPEPTPFERFDDDVPSPGTGIPIASLSGPLFPRALYDTVSMPDVLLRVAAGLGDRMADALPWEDYEAALRVAWAGLHESGRGSVAESTPTRFWQRALEAGGWWDAGYTPRAEFETPDGRYRFERGPFEEAAPDAAARSGELALHVYPSAAFGDGRSAYLPYLQELADPLTGVRWGTVVELSSTTAAAHGIADGDLVEVSSAEGRLRAPAHVTPGLRPDVVAVAAGQGHAHFGRFAQDRGANVFALLAPSIDPGSGEVSLVGTQVTIRRV